MFLCVCLSVCLPPGWSDDASVFSLWRSVSRQLPSLGPGFADKIEKKMEGRKTQGEVFKGG